MLREGHHIHADFGLLDDRADITAMTPVARVILDGFRDRRFDEVVIAHTQFEPGARLRPAVRQLLPLGPSAPVEWRDYIYEPDPHELLLGLLPRVIRFQLYQMFLESLMAENMSRGVAMRAATQNAADIVDRLTIGYNKARQEAITAELMDILGGSAALVER